MSFKSIKLLPLLLVFGLLTALGACSAEEATSPDNSLEQESVIEPEGAGATVEAE